MPSIPGRGPSLALGPWALSVWGPPWSLQAVPTWLLSPRHLGAGAPPLPPGPASQRSAQWLQQRWGLTCLLPQDCGGCCGPQLPWGRASPPAPWGWGCVAGRGPQRGAHSQPPSARGPGGALPWPQDCRHTHPCPPWGALRNPALGAGGARHRMEAHAL